MKRTAVILVILSLAVWAGAQTSTQGTQPSTQGTQPATPAGQTAGTASPAPAQPTGKLPPQTKTPDEYEAWIAFGKLTDAPGMEKAADDFAAKFPDSEVRGLMYKHVMRKYQGANNAEKTEAMGRKLLAVDGDDPEALVTVAEVIAERTRDSDLDKDQKFDEAIKMAQKATQTVDTDISVPAGTTQDKIDAFKSFLKSSAYSIIGTIEFKKDNYTAAQDDLQKSIDAFPSSPDPVVVLRLALVLDRQKKYSEALKVANRAVDLTQDNTPIGTPARHERDRLQQLTGGAAPAPAPATPQSQPPKN